MHAQLTLFLSLFLGGLVLNGNELDLERIIAKHCFDCHGDQKSKGGLNLQQLDFHQLAAVTNQGVHHGALGDGEGEGRREVLRILNRVINHKRIDK